MAQKRGKATARRNFGQLSTMRSGRIQARYTGPDGQLHTAPSTFEDRDAATVWLSKERRLIEDGEWRSPAERKAAAVANRLTFAEYATTWLATRKVRGRPLAERTRDGYKDLLDRFINPTFGKVELRAITDDAVDTWYERTATDRPATQAHAYGLLRTILNTAVERRFIPFNPCKVRGGGSSPRRHQVSPATIHELAVIVKATPSRRRLMVQLAAWCGLRYGEIAELRRGDIDTKRQIIKVRRGVVRVKDGDKMVARVKDPKTVAGIRDVPIPPHLLPDIRTHLLEHTQPGREGLLFATSDGRHITPANFYGQRAEVTKQGKVIRPGKGYYEARRLAGRDDLHFHDLRHTGLTNAAVAGATIAELMAIAGHSTPAAAMRYQHAAADRMQDLAKRLSAIAAGSKDGN